VTYVRKFAEAVDRAARQPWGPVLYGVPQDVSEKPWIPIAALTEGTAAEAPATVPLDEAAVPLIAASSRPVILIDDYALRIPGIREALDSFSRRIGAAVLQLRYRRGLMMFERLQPPEVRNYVGWLNPFSPAQRAMLDECDLFITVEDRNIYQRVAGDLPPCRKLAINTDPAKVHKNEYLGSGDVLLEGDAATVLTALSEALGPDPDAGETWFAAEEVRKGSDLNAEMPSDLVFEGRTRVADAVAGLVSGWSRPVLIDDSSMFGGLLVEHYDKLPLGLRVFGGHGGFVGGGLAYAIGLAIAEPEAQVICTLGDQAFTNSHQALVAAVQQRANLVILVCNNGRAVSLNKQAVASYGEAPRHYLDNVDEFRYCDVAQAIGVAAERVSVPVGAAADVVAGAAAELSGALARAGAVDGPALVELVLPADPEAWKGIWVASGFEQNAPVHAS
jgi:acetolactate synthase-1/2/3 large subunit